MKDTRKDLVEELRALLPTSGASKRKLLGQIISAAEKGMFHDFKSPLAAPKTSLIYALREASCNTIARRVVNGEFDEKHSPTGHWQG